MEEEKLLRIQEDHFQLEEEEQQKAKSLANKFVNFLLSQEERTLMIWKKKMEERDSLLQSLPYSEDNFEKLDKLLMNGKAIWERYMACVKEYEKTLDNTSVKGGEEESLLDAGDI